MAIDALRANKLNTFLNMLGVVIGSAGIVLVVSVVLTGKQYIRSTIEGVGTNIVYAHLLRASGQQSETRGDEITLADMEAVKRSVPQVVEVAGTRDDPATVVVEGVERPVEWVGVTPGFQRIRNLLVLRGRFLDSEDMAQRSKVCLLTEQLALRLFPAEDPIGRAVRLGELHLTVIGVFRERVATFGQSEIQRESVVIPFSLMRLYADDFVRTLYVQADRAEDVPAVTRAVKQVLESRHRTKAAYEVSNLTGLLDTANTIGNILTAVLLGVAFIALVISGIGIMNIQLVTISQRTREIGVRKATGARREEIQAQFMLEAIVISVTGGLIGICIAAAIPAIVNSLLLRGTTVPISAFSIFLALVVSCLTGVAFGYLPASRAAKLQPTESLRYE